MTVRMLKAQAFTSAMRWWTLLCALNRKNSGESCLFYSKS